MTVTELLPSPDCDRDAATITVRLAGGEDDVEVHVAHARGSLVRPLTDAELLTPRWTRSPSPARAGFGRDDAALSRRARHRNGIRCGDSRRGPDRMEHRMTITDDMVAFVGHGASRRQTR